ncbi:MAG: NAD-binding protein [Thermoflexales bacterium]|nr:NAD-binding protein [Thermoflexales bacterium]
MKPVDSRTLRAYFRDTRLLVREFRYSLLLFTILLLIGTVVLRFTYNANQPLGWGDALDTTVKLMFFETTHEYPQGWPAQIVFFMWPLLGLILVVNGVVRFWTAFFNRRERREAWEVAVASTYRNHVVVCGLGKVGYRVVLHLLGMQQEVVGVDKDPGARFLPIIRKEKVPIIIGNARQQDVLEKAGVRFASAIVAATEDDLTNLDIALAARRLNPGIQVVLRMFDQDLAERVREGFGFQATFSTSALAAPALAAAATRAAVEYSFYLNDVLLNISRLTVNPNSALVGRQVGDVEQELDLSILLISDPSGTDFHPPAERVLRAGDQVVVFASLEALACLNRMNQVEECPPEERKRLGWLRRLGKRQTADHRP